MQPIYWADLEKTRKCQDGEPVAVAEYFSFFDGNPVDMVQPDPALRPIFRDGMLFLKAPTTPVKGEKP